MTDKNDKNLFTLDVVSSIDDDVIEKNLKKRCELWLKKDKRGRIRMTPFIAAAACICIIIGTLVALLPIIDKKQVPAYIGMTVSNDAPISENELANALADPEFDRLSGVAGHREELKKGNGKAPDIVFGETYYAMKNEDIYIHIHLTNPDEFEILSFTLNGKKYSSNMFEYGSDLETLIIKYNVGDVNGLQEYTIDAIKYVDGEKIKDVRMEGDQTVKVFVNDDTVSLSFSSSLVGFDLVIDQVWSEEFTGKKEITSLSLWEGEQKLRDLEPDTKLISDLPTGKRLILKATYMEGDREKTVQHIFDTRFQSEGLAINTSGVITGIGSCTDTVLYINMPIADLAFSPNTTVSEIFTGPDCTYIGTDAFVGCAKLTKAVLGEGLTELMPGALGGCPKLNEIELPSSLKTIGYAAFSSCTSLKRIDIPDGVTAIEKSTFAGCQMLSEVDLPDGIKSIGESAFSHCTSLERIDIPDGVTAIENGAFASCQILSEVDLPDKLESIGAGAFSGCQLKELTLPGTLSYCAYSAFDGNPALERIVLEEGITEYPRGLSSSIVSVLQSAVIPKSLKKIGVGSFRNFAETLMYIEYMGTMSEWGAIEIQNRSGLDGIEIRCTDGSFTYTEPEQP